MPMLHIALGLQNHTPRYLGSQKQAVAMERRAMVNTYYFNMLFKWLRPLLVKAIVLRQELYFEQFYGKVFYNCMSSRKRQVLS